MMYFTIVSVPLWGLFNLTIDKIILYINVKMNYVSVPLWGLFNLTSK